MRTAIDCLPERTRRAMLDGVRSNTIVVGAYTDGRGGICPMLAAHRNGGRTSFLSFARAWDAFARAESVRPATARELRVLEDLLVASLAEEPGGDVDLAGAIADHRAVVERRRRSAPEILARRLRPSKARSRSRPDAPASDPARPPAPEAGAVRTAS